MSGSDDVTGANSLSGADLPDQPLSPAATSVSIPLAARLAHEIPKPKDWQAFQRNCVLLFRGELNDPHAQEYGRSGQKQRGIDILGRRNGDPGHAVGVQCRLVTSPLKEAKILQDCQAALAHEAGLKEILFVTTAPDDTRATDAANRVEHKLRSEGHDLRVVVYGWGQLQTLIAVHDVAYAAFCPSIFSSSAPQAPATAPASVPEFAAQVAAHVLEGLRQTGHALPLRQVDAAGSNDEDPALHARIDTFRDLFKEHRQLLVVEKGLLSLLAREDLEGKPWARFRVETNLGSIALDLGREAEAADRYEAAHAVRPGDPKAVANLALARTIQGRFDEAMDLARQALSAVPRADHAVAYLLQAAARSSWQGDPESLIPADLTGSEVADIGLAEFLRRRNATGWAERTLELSRRHPDVEDLKRIRALAILALALEEHAFVIGGQTSVSAEDLNGAADYMKAAAERSLDIGFADEDDLLAYLNNAALLLRLSGRHEECESLLQRGLPKVREEPSLRRILALAQAANGRRTAAIATLAAGGEDPENQLLSIELGGIDDPRAALARAVSIDASGFERRVGWLRWQLVGELALKVGDADSLKSAVAGLRQLDPADVTADLLEIRGEQRSGLDDEAVRGRLRGAVAALPTDAGLITRYQVAEIEGGAR
jgi:cellulose synthase operon protein C